MGCYLKRIEKKQEIQSGDRVKHIDDYVAKAIGDGTVTKVFLRGGIPEPTVVAIVRFDGLYDDKGAVFPLLSLRKADDCPWPL